MSYEFIQLTRAVSDDVDDQAAMLKGWDQSLLSLKRAGLRLAWLPLDSITELVGRDLAVLTGHGTIYKFAYQDSNVSTANSGPIGISPRRRRSQPSWRPFVSLFVYKGF